VTAVAPHADLLAEARRILERGAGVPLRLLGGAAVALSSPTELLLPRAYNDIDFVTAAGRGPEAVEVFEELGYLGDRRFNGLNGHRRLRFFDEANARRVDVFVAKFEMCHALPLAGRLTVNARTIPLADLLLTKLQIVALNEKDQRDVVNLLHAHPLGSTDDEGSINADYVAGLLAGDWGLWRTATLNLERVRGALGRYGLAPEQEEVVRMRIDALRSRVDERPKSSRWKLRARLGERVKWYEEPEEVG
jgi:hypothetical protein